MKRALALALCLLLGCKKQPRRAAGPGAIAVDRSRPGIELVYQCDPGQADAVLLVLRQRLARAGLDDAEVVKRGDRVFVELPGLAPAELARVRRIIGSTGGLEFALVVDQDPYLDELIKRAAQDDDARSRGVTVKQGSYGQGQAERFLEAPDHDCLQGYLDVVARTLPVPAGRRLVLQKLARDAGPMGWRSYLVGPAELGNPDIASVELTWDQQTLRPEVQLSFKPGAGQRFAELTRDNVHRRLAIMLDGEISSAPVIESAIGGGKARISMGGSDPAQAERDATDLVNVLRSVTLPTPLVEVTR